MKVNLDLTAAAAGNLITDELKNNVGAAAFNLAHNFFYGSAELEIWTGAGKTGTQLTENVDYTLAGIDANFTARAGRNVYTTVTIDNVTYQTGDLYFTYQATADYVDADDRYIVVRATGQYWELTAGGAFEVYTTDVTADSVKVDTLGGLDIDTDAGVTINDDSGSSINMALAGTIDIKSATDQNLNLNAQGTGTATIASISGQTLVRAQSSTGVDALRILADAGGIDVDSILGVHIKDLYGDTGTGNGITLLADNDNASGTGGNITLENTATSGTAGEILLKPGSKIMIYGDILPDTTEVHDIGGSSLKFDNIWAKTGHFDASTIFLGTNTVLKVSGGKFQLSNDAINFQTFATQGNFKLLIYYGSPQGINALWDNDLAAQELSFWDYIILGEGLQDSGHADYANNTAIVTKLKIIRPDIKIFGYIDIGVTTNNDSEATMQSYADDWITFGAHGVFYDNAGYDFQVPRARQNNMITYAHNNDMLCFINAWDPDDVFETAVEVTYNPTGVASTASAGDYYLAESFVVNTNVYSANNGYAQQADVINKGNKIIGYANTMGIISMANGIIQNADTTEERLAFWDTFQAFALIFGMKGYGIMPYQYSSAAPMADVGLRFDFIPWADEFYTDTVEYYLDGSWETFRREQNGHNVTGYIKNTTGPYYGLIDGIATRAYADMLPYRDAQISIGHADFNFSNIYVSNIKDEYNGTGTGIGITVTSDVNNASGTGGNITLQTVATLGTPGNIVIGSAAALTFDDQYTTSPIPFSETGETGLDTTATSIVGAINELAGAGGGGSLDDAYNLGSAVTVDTTDVDWVLSASRDFRVYDATDASKFVITNGTGVDSINIDTSGGVNIDVETRIDITQETTDGSGHAGINITTDVSNGLYSGQDIRLLAKESISGSSGHIRLTTQGTISGSILLNSGGYAYVDANEDSRFQVTSSNLDLKTVTSGNVTIDSAAIINLKTAATTRVAIAASGDTVFYGTATVDGALPVITLDQADFDEPFFKVIGDAASANLTRNIIDTGDVTTPTIVGYIKIEVLDDGDQVTDGDYFIPFYSLA